jgi:hypothetical protein
MDPDTDEATQRQLHFARAQGDAYGDALEHMTTAIADDGGQQRAGDYWIGYAVEEAEGMYEWRADELVWTEPGETNLHVEITVRDAGDGRFSRVDQPDPAPPRRRVQRVGGGSESSHRRSCDTTKSTASASPSQSKSSSPT